MYKQTNTICKPKRIRLFALIINCIILKKTNSRFSQNVYTISDRTWCNKHLRHTTTEKYENNWKGGYFRFHDDNNMSYRYILSITLLKWASWTQTTPYSVMKIKGYHTINDSRLYITIPWMLCVWYKCTWYQTVWSNNHDMAYFRQIQQGNTYLFLVT